MNRDLEATLEEMGPSYLAVVGRLRAGRSVEPRRRGGALGGFRLATYLAAASLLLLLGVSAVILSSVQSPRREVTRRQVRTPHDYAMTRAELIASQKPDGSWQNDFLTRRNAEILKAYGDPSALIAYKKAMRNLRLKGIL